MSPTVMHEIQVQCCTDAEFEDSETFTQTKSNGFNGKGYRKQPSKSSFNSNDTESTAASCGRSGSFADSENYTSSCGERPSFSCDRGSFSRGGASFSIMDEFDEAEDIAKRSSFERGSFCYDRTSFSRDGASFSIMDDFDEDLDIAKHSRPARRSSFEYDDSEALVSRIYKERYGETRPSFERDDDGTITVFKVESIKKELGIGKPRRRCMFTSDLVSQLSTESMVERQGRPRFEL